MEAEPDGRIAEIIVMGVGAVVEEHVGLVEDEPLAIDWRIAPRTRPGEGAQGTVEPAGPTGPQAADRGGAGKRLVEDVVGEDGALVAEALGDVPPGCGIAIL